MRDVLLSRKLTGLLVVGLASLVMGSVSACGSSVKNSGFGSGDGGGPGPLGGGDGSAPLLGSDGGPINQGPPGCSQAAMLVYVIDEQGGLHSFDPPSLTFTTIGSLSCPGASTYNSMAIDRNATAWVNDTGGSIFKVSTSNASCQPTAYNAPPGYTQIGMGFSSDSAGGSTETLYVDGIGGSGLAKIDLSTMALTPIHNFDGMFSTFDCELTGTGSAQLFGFFTTQPANVAQIDKGSAHVISNAPQPGVATGTDWAFSFWGGDFYLYTADTTTNPGDTSNVTRYRPSDGTTTVMLQQVGFRIVGAGVSTCAPTTTPK